VGRNKSNKGLADPSRLAPVGKGGEVKVVIETPKGSRNKYAFDQERKVFALKKVLPAGMAFPYDFGFVPSTLADDGDPVDVLVLMDEPAFPGCLLKCRLIGVIQGEQGNGKKSERNDRVVAVETGNHAWADIEEIGDLGKQFVKELEEFFVNYHELDRRDYRILHLKGLKTAHKCVQEGMKAFSKG
jgi:inorganic pyrophosphatase